MNLGKSAYRVTPRTLKRFTYEDNDASLHDAVGEVELMRITTLGLAFALLIFAGAPSPAAVRASGVTLVAGQGQYSAPSWFPLRGTWVIGCTWSNGCAGGYHGYAAIDIARNPQGSISGDPVYSAGAGLASVASMGNTCGSAGNAVVVDHGSGVKSYYFHLSRIAFSGATWVDQNSVIGYVGATGNVQPCTFNHLHFEVRVNGARVSPGALKACVGARLTSYPAELGRADWSQVPLWTGVTNTGTGCAAPPPPPPPNPPLPATGELSRYLGDDHVSLTWGPRSNDRFEHSLGTVSKVPLPGAHPIYLCRVGSADNFTSADSACEGQLGIGLLGYLYDSPDTAEAPTVPVRRCMLNGSGEHFDSNDLNCEGHHREHILGYALARTSLSRYLGDDHVTLTWGARSNDRFEGSLGVVSTVPVAGAHAIYLCRVGAGDNFTSLDSACEGHLGVGLLGYLYDSPDTAEAPVVPVRRCMLNGSGEHFDSNDLNCEGHHREHILGYALARTSLSRYLGDDHVTLTWGPRSNDRFEGSLGTVSKVPLPGAHPIYLCRVGSADNFTSADSACEGQLGIGLLGYLYDSPDTAEAPTVPVRRCMLNGSGEHFDSNDLNCEGHHREHILGYALAS